MAAPWCVGRPYTDRSAGVFGGKHAFMYWSVNVSNNARWCLSACNNISISAGLFLVLFNGSLRLRPNLTSIEFNIFFSSLSSSLLSIMAKPFKNIDDDGMSSGFV